jgi:hypothetical protein
MLKETIAINDWPLFGFQLELQTRGRRDWENLKTSCTVNGVKELFLFTCNNGIGYLCFKKSLFPLTIF